MITFKHRFVAITHRCTSCQAFIQTSAEAGKEVLETLETIDKHLDCLPGDDHLISAKERLEQQACGQG